MTDEAGHLDGNELAVLALILIGVFAFSRFATTPLELGVAALVGAAALLYLVIDIAKRYRSDRE